MYMMLKYEPVLIYLFIIMQITSLHQIPGFSISIFFTLKFIILLSLATYTTYYLQFFLFLLP